jgi:hypothetical protein
MIVNNESISASHANDDVDDFYAFFGGVPAFQITQHAVPG